MSRTTYKNLKEWVANYNNAHDHKVELSAFDGAYWIYDAQTHERIVSDLTPAKTWELFCAWKAEYASAVRDMKEGK